MEKKIDKRIIKTRHSIKEAFLKLVMVKDVNKITVSDIAAEAVINRATFYLHYYDTADVIQDIEKDVASAVVDYLNETAVPGKDLYKVVYDFLKTVDQLMERMIPSRKLVLCTNNSQILSDKLKTGLVLLTTSSADKLLPQVDKGELAFAISFAASGLIDNYLGWYYSDNKPMSLDKLLEQSATLVCRVLEPFFEK